MEESFDHGWRLLPAATQTEAAERLSMYVDCLLDVSRSDELQQSLTAAGTSEAGAESVPLTGEARLDRVLLILRLLKDCAQDFWFFYERALAQRLLRERFASLEHELVVLELLQKQNPASAQLASRYV